MRYFSIPVFALLLGLCLVGCATMPKGFLKLPEDNLKKRQLQTRQYDTIDEEKIMSAVAGVLQDLGFTLDDSETKVGLVSASKQSDATDSGQVAGAFFLDLLSAMGGSQSNALSEVDAVQKIKASVISKLSLDGSKIVVRVTFQRLVWDKQNRLKRVETVDDQEIYQKFFESLSKSVFLEGHKI